VSAPSGREEVYGVRQCSEAQRRGGDRRMAKKKAAKKKKKK
jgi:hypothetical protein